MGVRRPVVAGAFYPADPQRLRESIHDCFTHDLGPGEPPSDRVRSREILAVVCPHAGYVYSGPTAAHSYYHLASEAKPEAVVLIGPNHTGLGGPISMWGTGAWETPLGQFEVDERLAMAIFEASDIIDIDESAHLREHSLEVQLPFLQYIYGDVGIVPICMGFQDLETSREVGRALAKAVSEMDALILASTDLTHMELRRTAQRKDQGVIDLIVSMDEEGLQRWVSEQRVTMCGYGPVSAALVASKRLGAVKAELLSYSTSGDITGDFSAVVGYASAKIMR
ncbi:MAG: AmmeMemoRadiSam system protein B [Candidatus Bathyarchaeota archaeon]|jgi:AmmeMemoRadiSam system protein B